MDKKPRLIDADALLKVVEDRYLSACAQAKPNARKNGRGIHYGIAIGMNFVRNVINELPTIDAEPVRHGWWVQGNIRPKSYFRLCSVCKKLAYFCGEGCSYKYCPNCGAKMDGGAEQ